MKISLLGILASVLASTDPIFKNCGKATDLFSVTSISVSAHPFVIGTSVVISVTGTTAAVIKQGSKYRMALKLGILPVYSETWDFCETTALSGVSCPIAPGQEHQFSFAQVVRSDSLAGTYNMKITVTNADGKPLTCQEASIKIAKVGKKQ